MRPVTTWKYTLAPPTPARLGPRPGTPCAFRPWQVMQLLLNSCSPRWAEADSGVPCAAADGENAVYTLPTIASAAIIRAALPSLRRRGDCGPRRRDGPRVPCWSGGEAVMTSPWVYEG